MECRVGEVREVSRETDEKLRLKASIFCLCKKSKYFSFESSNLLLQQQKRKLQTPPPENRQIFLKVRNHSN